jgi:hypothetical protein
MREAGKYPVESFPLLLLDQFTPIESQRMFAIPVKEFVSPN